jgi:2-keto-3-deoxy-L-rhamnonate aldolase RhmA
MSRMYERIANGQPAIGTMMLTPGRELVEVAGYSGLDFVCIDMMVTPTEWGEAAEMVLGANRYGVTPWLRVSAYPWGGDVPDPGLPAQVLRALSIGAECVLASVNTARQVEALLHPLSNPHRRYYIRQGGADRTDEQRTFDAAEAEQRVVPIIESASALEHIDQILAVHGLRQIYLGMGDLTEALGHEGDDRHPTVRDAVGRLAAKARERGITVTANTLGYRAGVAMSEQVLEGVRSLWQLGVQAILTPRPTLVLQTFYESVLGRIRADVTQV